MFAARRLSGVLRGNAVRCLSIQGQKNVPRLVSSAQARCVSTALTGDRSFRFPFSQSRLMGTSSLPDHEIIKLPALSPTMEMGTIVGWEKKEGEEIEEGDVLARIETDKAVMEWEASAPGFVAKIFIPEGSKDVKLGTPLCVIVSDESDVAAFKDYAPPAGGDSGAAAQAAAPTAAAPTPATPAATSTAAPPQAAPVAPPAGSPSRIFASPLARMTAAQQNVDLSAVAGSGPGGRIRQADVSTAAQSAVTTPAPAARAGDRYADLPLSNIRKVIARRLTESKQSIPHYYLSVDAHMDNVLDIRADLNKSLDGQAKLSVNDFVIKAAALACMKVPEVNSSWQDTFIRQYNNVDVSVAVATPTGLITPIVFDADRKGLLSINQDVMRLAEKAKSNALKPEEFQGGTFTISNLGMFGVKNFTAIINPPQSCILAVGGTERRLVPDESSEQGYRTAQVMSVTLSCDHRVVDGAVGAQWLAAFRKNLEQPMSMML
ncbi:dihydrolipoyllysine-residue acetyltransferase component of pyruvate dehydrogenase complex-like [Sycon ciliatum]|uniref:dihydrolipoyllysine-residue acetyltransferase component of pyruvate dehydrogenase complex-like n=1 Tax=Sycon ciliatum TaxID=27933 RepID=UPI0031F66E29